MVAMRIFWLLGKNGCYGRYDFLKPIFSKLFAFYIRGLIIKVQSNKSVYQSKQLSKCIFCCYGKFASTSE